MLPGRKTILQAALYVAIVSVLALVLLDRLQPYLAIAERSAMEVTLSNARSGLHLRLAYERMKGVLSRERQWDGGNPFSLAQVKAQNYVGELDDEQTVPPGMWAFNRQTGELVYRPKYPRGLMLSDGESLLRFRLNVSGAAGVPQLVAVASYTWEP